MQKVITKIKIKEDSYYKVMNVVNDQVVHINIYKTVGDSFNEITPSEVDNTLGAILINPKHNMPVNSTESKILLEKIDKLVNVSRKNISVALDNLYEIKTRVKLVSSFIGVVYCVVEFDGKPFYEIFQVILDDKSEVKGFSLINQGNMEAILSDVAVKIPLYGKAKFIQVDTDNFYGIKEDSGTIVLSHMIITDTEMYCKKAYGIKKTGKKHRFYAYSEVTEKLTEKIETISSDIMEELKEKVKSAMMKALDEYGD